MEMEDEFEHLARHISHPHHGEENVGFVERYIISRLPRHYTYVVFFLVLLGFCTAVIGACMDIAIGFAFDFHTILFSSLGMGNVLLEYFLWVSYGLVFMISAILLTKYIAPTAAGSGIPEMKSILSGHWLTKYLSFRTLCVKVIGLILSVGSGAFLGKEGPFVHTASILANQLSRLSLFVQIRRSAPLMLQVLTAGCATGVAANFGAPIGGILFSIEVTSTYYPIRNYWAAYVAALPAGVLFRYLWNWRTSEPGLNALMQTSFDSDYTYGFIETVFFIALGVLCGLLGVLFIQVNSFVMKSWRRYSASGGTKLTRNPFVYAIVIMLITGTVGFPKLIGSYVGLPSIKAANQLFSPFDLEWEHSVWVALPVFFVCRFFLTAVSIIMATPLGLYTPIFTAGASLGRFVGEFAKWMQDSNFLLWSGSPVIPGGYAVVGAAALAAGTTHTISSAMIVFELTGQIHHLMPVLISVVTAVSVAKKISSLSIYDSVGKNRDLPFMPDIQQHTYDIVASDIMNVDVQCLTSNCQGSDAIKVLGESNQHHFPVIESTSSMLLLGSIPRTKLEKAVELLFQSEQDVQRELVARVASPSHSGGETPMVEGETTEAEDQQQRDSNFQIPPLSHAMTVQESTPLVDIHLLILSMRLSNVFVTDKGRLVGVISRRRVRDAITERDSVVTLLKY